MSRPTLSTPIPTLVLTVNAVCEWYERHGERLSPILLPGVDHVAEGRAASAELNAAFKDHLLEQRQDVNATRDRVDLVLESRTLINAIEAGAERAFASPDAPRPFAEVKRHFRKVAPSHIRTVPAAQMALQRARAAVEAHADVLDAGVARSARFIEALDRLEVGLTDASALEAREAQETRLAMQRREAARGDALEFTDQARLVARELAITDSEPLADLETIFAQYAPTTRSGSSGVDSDEDGDEAEVMITAPVVDEVSAGVAAPDTDAV